MIKVFISKLNIEIQDHNMKAKNVKISINKNNHSLAIYIQTVSSSIHKNTINFTIQLNSPMKPQDKVPSKYSIVHRKSIAR